MINKYRSADLSELLATLLDDGAGDETLAWELGAAVENELNRDLHRLLDLETINALSELPEFMHCTDAINRLLALQELFIRIGVDASVNKATH